MSLPVIIVGGGGHARVIVDALRLARRTILGICDPALVKGGCGPLGVKVLGGDAVIDEFGLEKVELANAVGSTQSTAARRAVYEAFTKKGYRFATIVHPSAIVAGDVSVDDGVQIMAGAIIQSGVEIGENVIVNTGARVDHDCVIGKHVHISPGVTLSGNVRVGSGAHVGVGATVIQGISLGENCVVGAGGVVLRDLLDGERVVSPATRSLSNS